MVAQSTPGTDGAGDKPADSPAVPQAVPAPPLPDTLPADPDTLPAQAAGGALPFADGLATAPGGQASAPGGPVRARDRWERVVPVAPRAGQVGRPIGSGELSEQQLRFVTQIISGAPNATEAARRAGYKVPGQAAYDLTRNPRIADAIRTERAKRLDFELVPLALNTLRDVLRDSEARAADRVRAASVVLDHVHKAQRIEKPHEKDPSRMTVAELEAYIAAAESRLKDVTPTAQPQASGT